MPKVGLSFSSSFENLFHTIPDLSKLRVFCCLRFLWLRPYSYHKIDPKSSPCVFLGYSLTQSVFLGNSQLPRPPTCPTSPIPFHQQSPSTSLLAPITSPSSPNHTPDPLPIPPFLDLKVSSSNPTLRNGLTTVFPPISKPCTIAQALQDPKWVQAMQSEYAALIRNCTWSIIPSSPRQNIVGNKWVFRIKKNLDGSIARYKARLVAKGFHQ